MKTMWFCTVQAIVLAVLLLTPASSALAQTCSQITLSNMPTTTGNTRFFSDLFAVTHPSLSINGFSCSGTACDKGYGLKQILEKVYASAPEKSVKDVYELTLALAADDTKYKSSPTDRDQVAQNTTVFQARAFVALVTYILEKNGYSLSTLNQCTVNGALPTSHATAMTRLRAVMLNPTSWTINKSYNKDAIKWAMSMANVARAWDVYLGLENAYKHYNDPDYTNVNSTKLLWQSLKDTFLSNYTTDVDKM